MSSISPNASSMALAHEGWDHLRLRRPLAARASWQRALRLGDDTSAAAQAMATLESAADLPAAARTVYRLRPPADAGRRGAWDDRLRGLAGGGAGSGGGLGDANLAAMADAFGRLAAEGLPDPAAWYNRALCLAWLGSNREAVACLARVVELEAVPAPERAVEAWTLAELLRQGGGAEDLADDLRYACTIDWDPVETASLLDEFPGDLPDADAAGAGRRPGHGSGGRGLRVAGSDDTGGRRSRPEPSCDGRRLAGRPGERDGRPVVADAAALEPAGGDAPAGRGAPVLPAGDMGRGIDPAPARGVAAAAAVPRRRRLDGPHGRRTGTVPGRGMAAGVGRALL